MQEPVAAPDKAKRAPYFPFIIKARMLGQWSVGEYRAVLVDECISMGPIHYTYALYLRPQHDWEPVLCMASEIADGDPDQSGRFLCMFHEGIHRNYGFSDDWLDLKKFVLAGFSIAAETLGIDELPVELPLETEPGFRLRFLPPWGK